MRHVGRSLLWLWNVIISGLAHGSHWIFSRCKTTRTAIVFLVLLYFVSLLFVGVLRPYPGLALLLLCSVILFNLGISIFYFKMHKEKQAVIDGLLFRQDEDTLPTLRSDTRQVFDETISDDAPRTQYLTSENEQRYTTGIMLFANIFQIIFFGCLFVLLYRIGGEDYYRLSQHPTLLAWVVFTVEHVFRAADIMDIFEGYEIHIASIHQRGIITGSVVSLFRLLVDVLLIQTIVQYFAFRQRKRNVIAALALDPENAKIRALRIGRHIIPDLIAALSHQNHLIRKEAAMMLGVMKIEKAIGPLCRALKDDEAEVRESAILALKELKATTAINNILTCLSDPESTVQWKAIEALGELKDIRVLPQLIETFNTGDEYIQKRVVQAVGHFVEKKAVEFLRQHINHPKAQVRTSVLSSLSYVASMYMLEEEKEQYDNVVQEFGRATDNLVDVLTNSNDPDRCLTIEAIGVSPHAHAQKALIEALDDNDRMVRLYVIKFFEDRGDPSVVPLLEKKLTDVDEEVKETAEYAIAVLTPGGI